MAYLNDASKRIFLLGSLIYARRADGLGLFSAEESPFKGHSHPDDLIHNVLCFLSWISESLQCGVSHLLHKQGMINRFYQVSFVDLYGCSWTRSWMVLRLASSSLCIATTPVGQAPLHHLLAYLTRSVYLIQYSFGSQIEGACNSWTSFVVLVRGDVQEFSMSGCCLWHLESQSPSVTCPRTRYPLHGGWP